MRIKCILIFFTYLFMDLSAIAQESPSLYIMLNIDKTIVDRVENCNQEKISELKAQNIHVQELKYIASSKTSPKFVNIYRKLANKEKLANEVEYMHKVQVTKLNEDEFEVTECVAIRPTLSVLLYQLTHLKIPTTILLTSRNDDVRTENLRNNLQVQIYGKTFNEVTTLAPRDYFRIKTSDRSAKSAKELRKNLKYIKDDNFIIMLDHLEDKRFIKSDPKKDFNIYVPKFSLDVQYDYVKDEAEIMAIINKIKQSAQIS